ncbi:thiamine phosphate synthase [Granulicella mallensis]|uniref:Thiamine-phosphate pyrophosphorylase n=1 Tax=Granulicella mallensis TaxID=940614 RepID=A0A7W8EAY6_9BACT|nr:thiamine phosphate synthase [Granulicella mallensis]MBB5063980.1 thiamine-phosphate pyrophosphorylase [Granulicella mallensis]
MNTLCEVLRYAITDGSRFEDAVTRHDELIADARRWARQEIDFVQLREKTIEAGELLALAEAMAAIFREEGGHTKLLINSRVDVAIAARADGVHLTGQHEGLTPAQVQQLYANAAIVSMSCHSLVEVDQACALGASLILFGPVFEKRVGKVVVTEGRGIDSLRQACAVARNIPVLALGGVTPENAGACVEAGAAGIAGIRLFG